MRRSQSRLQPAGSTAYRADPARSTCLPASIDFGAHLGQRDDEPMTDERAGRRGLVPGTELGRCLVGGEWLSLHLHNDRSMWLCRNDDLRAAIGVIRWDLGKSPQIILDPRDRHFDASHSIEVVGMVDLAMAVWWCVVEAQPLDPMLPVAIHPSFARSVVYRSRNCRPDSDFPQQGTGPDS